MPTTYTLTPDETVTVRRHSAEALEVEVTYAAGASPPPGHFHPHQDERFEVLSGTVRAVVGGREHRLRAGDAIDIPRGVVHKLASAGDEPARAVWETRPAGRTLEWFAQLDANRGAGPLTLARLMTDYRDVFRLAARPRWLVTAVLAVLALPGRRGVTSPASPARP
jgi:quercetin dioxygenase-like cupin family protein